MILYTFSKTISLWFTLLLMVDEVLWDKSPHGEGLQLRQLASDVFSQSKSSKASEASCLIVRRATRFTRLDSPQVLLVNLLIFYTYIEVCVFVVLKKFWLYCIIFEKRSFTFRVSIALLNDIFLHEMCLLDKKWCYCTPQFYLSDLLLLWYIISTREQ